MIASEHIVILLKDRTCLTQFEWWIDVVLLFDWIYPHGRRNIMFEDGSKNMIIVFDKKTNVLCAQFIQLVSRPDELF